MANKVKIDKGIPIPIWRRLGLLDKYPFEALKVGDSLQVLQEDVHQAYVLANQASKRLGIKLIVRRMPDCVRIWRKAKKPKRINSNFPNVKTSKKN